jgi:choline/glycine/proline betaine transport protein
MSYTVYLGLRNEYEILESEEFAETIEELTAEGDVDVVTAGDEVVTDIEGADPEGSD